MIRNLASGKYRLYSRKKNPKTGHGAIWGRFLPGQRQRNTSELSSSTNGINAQSKADEPATANSARTLK